ncbi:hypothetical protein ACI79G_22700 [Geodermatophilus sp. SYSU D00779]
MRTGRWGATAVALGLTACTATVEGTASPGEPPDLEAALSAPVPGLRPVAPPPPPWQLCTTAPGTRAPRLDPALGEPVAVGAAAEGMTLYAYAWATSAPMVAEAILDQAEIEAPDCASAPPSADPGPGARTARSVDGWTGSGWTGVTIRTEVHGPAPAVGETRLVRSDEVVVLVVATGGEPDLGRVLDDHLAEVADRLG